MQYSIIRNNQVFGPYNISTIQLYVSEGKILLQDKVDNNSGKDLCVRDILKSNKVKYSVNSGSIFSQIQSFGLNLLLPKDSISF